MTVLVDTNILARLAQPSHPHHSLALAALDALHVRGHDVAIVPQVLYEFWTVCTRPPAQNGLGFPTRQAHSEQVKASGLFRLLPDNASILPEWQRFVVRHDVKGRNAHDARLVAAMNVHGVGHILTFNVADFARYPGITVLDPQSVVPPAGP